MGDDAIQDMEYMCYPAFDSLENALDQNPCQVARLLFRVCDSPESSRDDYSLAPLDPDKGQHHYPSPNQWQATECICSMAGYNLVQACAACQQTTPISSTSWNDWVSNCTMSNINFGKTFPYEIPGSTALPNWAYANNGKGAFSMADTFQRINSDPAYWPFNPANFSINTNPPPATSTGTGTARGTATASSTGGSAAGAYGEMNQGSTANDGDADDSSNNKSARIVVGIVIPLAVVGGLLVAAFLYVRRKRRTQRRHRGFRLGSDPSLPPPDFVAHHHPDDPFSDFAAAAPHHPLDRSPEMTQLHRSASSARAAGAPPPPLASDETVFARCAPSRSSFATNSVSTGPRSIVVAAPRTRGGGGRHVGVGRDPYGPRDSTSLFAPSSEYDSRSSIGYTYDDDDDDEDDEYGSVGGDSPFSDARTAARPPQLRRPRPTVVASRNNVLNPTTARSIMYSPSSSASASAYDARSDASSIMSCSDASSSRDRDPDAESLITLSSRLSTVSRAASSSGATYGGAHDDDDDDEFDDDDGGEFDFDDDDDDDDEGSGIETELGDQDRGCDSETETEREGFYDDDDDAISLNTTTSRGVRPDP
ncbi:hypothetical protein JCM11491_001251 [Sporobolomyces phaffii]